MKKTFLSFFAFICISVAARATQCVAIASGNWESSATWSCGSVPTCGDTITIPATYTVTITQQDSYYPPGCTGAMIIYIGGELNFVTGKKLALPCGSAVNILAGGVVNPGGGGGTSNLISICGTNVWTAGQGPLTGPVVLPVQLLYFTTVYNAPVVTIDWATASETNNKLFTIEKSADGMNWQLLMTYPGAGNSTQNVYYTLKDENPWQGLSYYRLEQTDFDGHSTFIATSFVNINTQFSANLFPNPSGNENTTLRYTSPSSEPVYVTITDMVGKEAGSYEFENVQTGNNNFILNTSSLSPGVYIIRAGNSQTILSLKLVKQ